MHYDATVVARIRERMFLILRVGLQMCVMLCADHGPCVSGAHNTIVTARAGKDLVSSLVSGEFLAGAVKLCFLSVIESMHGVSTKSTARWSDVSIFFCKLSYY